MGDYVEGIHLGDYVTATTSRGVDVQGVFVRDLATVAIVLGLENHDCQWHRCKKSSLAPCDTPSDLFAVKAALSNHFWDR